MGAGRGRGFPTGIRRRPCAPRGARRRARPRSALSAHCRGSSGTRPLPVAPSPWGSLPGLQESTWAVVKSSLPVYPTPCLSSPAATKVSTLPRLGTGLPDTSCPPGVRTINSVPPPSVATCGVRGRGSPAAPARCARCQPSCESWSRLRGPRGEGKAARPAGRAGSRGAHRARTRGRDGPRRPFSLHAQLCPSHGICTAVQPARLPRSPGGGSRGAAQRGARGATSRCEGAARRAPAELRLPDRRAPARVAGSAAAGEARGAVERTLPSIAATEDARRSSSRPARAIAGPRPPGRARGEAATRGGRRVPGRRCAPRRGLLRILSRAGWDRTPRSAAWAWAGVRARGAVRARVGVGVHVCVCVYGSGGCVRACVCERERGRGRASWGERASACASQCHIASSS